MNKPLLQSQSQSRHKLGKPSPNTNTSRACRTDTSTWMSSTPSTSSGTSGTSSSSFRPVLKQKQQEQQQEYCYSTRSNMKSRARTKNRTRAWTWLVWTCYLTLWSQVLHSSWTHAYSCGRSGRSGRSGGSGSLSMSSSSLSASTIAVPGTINTNTYGCRRKNSRMVGTLMQPHNSNININYNKNKNKYKNKINNNHYNQHQLQMLLPNFAQPYALFFSDSTSAQRYRWDRDRDRDWDYRRRRGGVASAQSSSKLWVASSSSSSTSSSSSQPQPQPQEYSSNPPTTTTTTTTRVLGFDILEDENRKNNVVINHHHHSMENDRDIQRSKNADMNELEWQWESLPTRSMTSTSTSKSGDFPFFSSSQYSSSFSQQQQQQQQQQKNAASTSTSTQSRTLTRSQIQSMRIIDLRRACGERNLSKAGNKGNLQDRLWMWTVAQQQQQQQQAQTQSQQPSTHREKTNLDEVASNRHVKITGDFLTRYFESPTTQPRASSSSSSSSQRTKNKIGFDQDNTFSNTSDDGNMGEESNKSTTPNSLAEWARTIDLEPLLQKRKEIHRQKREGKPSLSKQQQQQQQQKQKQKRQSTEQDHLDQSDYLQRLARTLRAPSSPYASNIKVKELYAASKQADQLGERKVAMDLLQTLLMVTPSDARVYRRLARMYTEQGDLQKARETLRNGLKEQPENAWLWHGLGQLERTHGSSQLAQEYFSKAIDCDAAFPQSYHALGTLQHTQGQVAKAMKTLKQGLEFCPTNHRLWHAYGDVYRVAQLHDDAIRCYRRALKHGPPVSHGFAFSSLAATAYEQGEIDQARKWLFQAIEVNNGRHSQGWIALAQLEESEGNIQQARLLCTSAIAQYEKGLLEARQRYLGKSSGQHQPTKSMPFASDSRTVMSSVDLTSQLLRQVPKYRSGDKFVHVYRNWARLEAKHGDPETVDRVYGRASAAFPNDYKLLITQAQYHLNLSHIDRAREILQDACNKARDRHADPYRILGNLEISQSDFAEARRILFLGTQAIVNNEKNNDYMNVPDRKGLPQLLLTWAICEWHLEQWDRAEELFEQALRLVSPADSLQKAQTLYTVARFKHARGELLLAQHCIGLCLKESGPDNRKAWELWAQVAHDMENYSLKEACLKKADGIFNNDDEVLISFYSEEDQSNEYHQSRSICHPGADIVQSFKRKHADFPSSSGSDFGQWMRREPWQIALFGDTTNVDGTGGSTIPSDNLLLDASRTKKRSSFLEELKFPSVKK